MAQNTFDIRTSELRDVIPQLATGDRVYLSGTVFTARDAAHKRIFQLLDSGGELPFPIRDSIIYYAGPTPAKNGMAVGSCGPTTSGRMDKYSPAMMEQGLKGMIGKGPRSAEVVEAMVKNKVVYFAAIGGAAALIADSVKECEVIAFDDLGPEAVRRLRVENYPCIVVIDAEGNNLYEQGVAKYRME